VLKSSNTLRQPFRILGYLDSYRSGVKVPFSGIYRVFHGQGHAEPHCVTLLSEDYFPQCSRCSSFVRFELIFDAPYIADHPLFKRPR